MRWYNRLRWKVAKLKEVAITNWRKNISRPTSRHLSSWFPTSSLSCVTCVTFFWFLKQDFHDWRIWENSLNLPPKLWTPGTTPPRIVGAGSSGAGGKLKMSWVSPSRHWQVLVGGGLVRMGDFICLPTQTPKWFQQLRFLGNCCFLCFLFVSTVWLGEVTRTGWSGPEESISLGWVGLWPWAARHFVSIATHRVPRKGVCPPESWRIGMCDSKCMENEMLKHYMLFKYYK